MQMVVDYGNLEITSLENLCIYRTTDKHICTQPNKVIDSLLTCNTFTVLSLKATCDIYYAYVA